MQQWCKSTVGDRRAGFVVDKRMALSLARLHLPHQSHLMHGRNRHVTNCQSLALDPAAQVPPAADMM